MIRKYKKKKTVKKRSTYKNRKLRGGAKKPKVLVYTHLGLGDMFLINGAVNYLATLYDQVHLVCRKQIKDIVEDMYSDNPSIKLVLVDGEQDMDPWPSKAQTYINDGFDIKSGGQLSINFRKDIYDYPNCYYDAMSIDRSVRKSHFHVPRTEKSKKLFEAFKGRPYIVVHEEFSNGKIPIVDRLINAGESRLIINLNKNVVNLSRDPKGHSIAESYVNRKLFTDYVDLIENAEEIHLIDSSVLCFAMHLNLSKVKRKVIYRRPGNAALVDSFNQFEINNEYINQLQYDNYYRNKNNYKK